MQALILVDIQNDFLPGGALAVPEGDEVIDVANRLMERFDYVVATRDWHPEGHVSFASQHPAQEPGETVRAGGVEQVLWPDHCVQNSEGAAFPSALNTDEIDAVIHKGEDPKLDSYSAFYDNGRVSGTGLTDLLRSRGVDAVFLAGLATDVCVKFSAIDACQDGFETFVVIDGCRGVELNPGDVDRAVEEMRQAGAKIVTSDEI